MVNDTDAPEVPTAEEMAQARATLERAALTTANPGKAAMIGLVTSDAFSATLAMMIEAQTVNRADGDRPRASTGGL